MGPTGQPGLSQEIEKLSELFSDYRAEWSAALFGDLFIAPPYFAKLESSRPCVLIGGRGTGKTTALKSLRFDSTEARLTSDSVPAEALKYYGIYIRINKNRVRAFQGPSLATDQWDKVFAHYFNILCCLELCRLAEWLTARSLITGLDLAPTAACFGLTNPPQATAVDASRMAHLLGQSLIALELFVNNPSAAAMPMLSMAEAPLRTFVEALKATPHGADRVVFCCLDEYENLSDRQQSIVNTYIKHAEPPLSYKIGVKRNGLRTRATIDRSDALSIPDDYQLIDIGEDNFEAFAKQVLEHRLSRAVARNVRVEADLDDFLPEFPLAVEAEKLGADRIAHQVLAELQRSQETEVVAWASGMPASQLYFLSYWAEGSGENILDLARDWMNSPDRWTTRLGNYGYASLFWLSKGRKGARIRKYYTGARTLIALASGNIRYVIELVDEGLAKARASETWTGSISPENQTLAARAVGKRRLDQLEDLSERGSDIKRLVLALGKVFFEFARDPVGKTPERTFFVLGGRPDAQKQVLSLLEEGVANLAFEVTPRTKATTQREMRDDEFRLHPIFAAFFEYSHRRKRRCVFAAETLLLVLENPSAALAELIERAPTALEELPDQLAMFSDFYEAATPGR